MGAIIKSARVHRTHRGLVTGLLALTVFGLFCARSLLHDVWTLASLPLIWWNHSEQFLISSHADSFDISFAKYSVEQTSAAPFDDRVPPILHHVAMGGAGAEHHIAKWQDVRQSCIEMHPGWEVHLWTDELASTFVADHFPELRETWENYRYPIQKIDALRYMILYHYGGGCLHSRRSCGCCALLTALGRRCHSRHGPSMSPGSRPAPSLRLCSPRRAPDRLFGRLHDGEQAQRICRRHGQESGEIQPALARVTLPDCLVQHGMPLRIVSSVRQLGICVARRRAAPLFPGAACIGPYQATRFPALTLFATRTIHAYQRNRTELKVLAGPPDNFKLHSLNGPVSTPIFNHLGSSSWHSYDAAMIVSLGKSRWKGPVMLAIASTGVFVAIRRSRRRRGVRV
jgi:hypothetical protein